MNSNEKYVKYFGGLTLIVVTLAIGIYLGGLLEESKIIKSMVIYITAQIAIVNLDAGVQYQNEQRNFAKELLENYSEDFSMTGLDDAKQDLLMEDMQLMSFFLRFLIKCCFC
ncbi:hypothetical protein [Faecalibacillus intestinalis]|uniref:hypothetical protein n=1 Tax=Faecalibacillus intestinalis TaxID=1982626 RepID=UPI003995AF80